MMGYKFCMYVDTLVKCDEFQLKGTFAQKLLKVYQICDKKSVKQKKKKMRIVRITKKNS
jgi:hypothetical protein